MSHPRGWCAKTTRGCGARRTVRQHTDCMHEVSPRVVPLVVIGAVKRAAAEPLAALMRSEGAIVLVAEGERACLRVASAVSPDVVLLDPRLSRGLVSLLRAHPFSRCAQVSNSQALGGVTSAATANQLEREAVVKHWFQR